MRGSTKFTDAVHTLVLMALNQNKENTRLSSQSFAQSIQTNPGFVRQLMSCLRQAELIETTPGHPIPALKKSPKEITLWEIYHAVEADKSPLRLITHPSPECGIGINIQYAIQDYYDQLDQTIRRQLEDTTLQDICDSYTRKVSGNTD